MEAATRRRATATPPLLLVLLLLAAGAPAGFGAINRQDASALNSLKSQWTSAPSSWSSASDPCDGGWDGVTCSNGRVTSLRLSSVNIQGTLSDSIGQLSQLMYLSAGSSANEFDGAGGGARSHPYSDTEITRGSYGDNASEYMPYFEVKPK
ncbi:hypothetical protein C2845_PM05G34080 [Panicum miliaceum]|uniref:Leucine-rich repeat-containing N-terminal plant-type domain-containing protein n=1 Tax=Panicum miliaceum TaxID=4540 RepID=A0A3L6SX67_PANMI|nr:hypothetical protein C2845_PM05G34080 [Panicum miliaceum]